jgi:hypothetical protein
LTSTFLTLVVVPILYTLLIKEGDDSELDIEDELVDTPEERIIRGEAADVADIIAMAEAHAPSAALPQSSEEGQGIRSSHHSHGPEP